MKTALKITIWAIYIFASPVMVVGGIAMLIHTIFKWYKDYGEISWTDIKDFIQALFEGYKEGHRLNMYTIEHIDD